jgi:hypothetical protein
MLAHELGSAATSVVSAPDLSAVGTVSSEQVHEPISRQFAPAAGVRVG